MSTSEERTLTLRRSELICPGHSLKMMTKAAASDADEVIFDLEDACAVSQKLAARALVIDAFRSCTFTGGKLRAFRVNGVHTAWCYRDVIEVLEAVGGQVDVVVLPKVQGPDDVRFLDTLISQVERAKGLKRGAIRIEALIETAKGLLAAEAIAGASPRMASLIFGVADYAGDTGAKDYRSADAGQLFYYPRAHLVAAARSAGIDVIDAVTVQFKDLAQAEADAVAGARLGFDGKWAIHPTQVPIINRVFTPSAEELARARRIVEAYVRADGAEGLGAIDIDGEMVDAATLTVERKKLAKAPKA